VTPDVPDPAIANLADLAGNISVTVRAESEKGFDQRELRNGVLEPLEEADMIKSNKRECLTRVVRNA
jgi:hypothetical protein